MHAIIIRCSPTIHRTCPWLMSVCANVPPHGEVIELLPWLLPQIIRSEFSGNEWSHFNDISNHDQEHGHPPSSSAPFDGTANQVVTGQIQWLSDGVPLLLNAHPSGRRRKRGGGGRQAEIGCHPQFIVTSPRASDDDVSVRRQWRWLCCPGGGGGLG